jgi:long-chain acyl-CoA synthetase
MNQRGSEGRSSFSSLFDDICEAHGPRTLARSAATGTSFSFAGLPGLSNLVRARILAAAPSLATGRVALLVNSPYLFTLLYLSLFRLGLTIIPVNPALPEESVARILLAATADAVISDMPVPLSASPVIQLSEASLSAATDCGGSAGPEGLAGEHEPAVIMFTSGTTSSPKGVVLCHGSLTANARHIAERLGVERSRLLGVLPLHFTNGQIFNVLIPFLTGSSIFCTSDYSVMSLGSFWSTIEECRIEYVDVVPTVLSALLALPPSRLPDVSSLKYLICGGAPLPADVLHQFQERFGVAVLQEYGLTEATCVSAMESPRDRRPGTVGRPLRGNEVAVRDEGGGVCAAGERGEIFIRGEYVMSGYLNAGDAVCVVDQDGWLATGDLGFVDDDGYLHVSGRRKSVIIKGGESIVPDDIENAARRCEWVDDVVAKGVADAFYGEAVELFVVWAGRVPREAELRETLRAEIPRSWWPKRVHSITAVPRNPSGKIMRDEVGTAESE